MARRFGDRLSRLRRVKLRLGGLVSPGGRGQRCEGRPAHTQEEWQARIDDQAHQGSNGVGTASARLDRAEQFRPIAREQPAAATPIARQILQQTRLRRDTLPLRLAGEDGIWPTRALTRVCNLSSGFGREGAPAWPPRAGKIMLEASAALGG